MPSLCASSYFATIVPKALFRIQSSWTRYPSSTTASHSRQGVFQPNLFCQAAPLGLTCTTPVQISHGKGYPNIMNETTWWDGVDGDNLACSPDNGDPALAITCLFMTRILAVILIGPGLGAMYVGTLHLRMATRVAPGIKLTNANGVSKKRALARSRRGAILCFMFGAVSLTTSLSFMVHGHGTMYSSRTLVGKIGDCIGK
jgi:hypothetical protein